MYKLTSLAVTIALILISQTSFSQTSIAMCGASSGYSFYPEIYPVTRKDAGWQKDSISSGKFALIQKDKLTFDVLFMDSSERGVVSAIQDGAKTLLLRSSKNEIAVLVNYPKVAEIYSFWRADNGNYKFSIAQSKGGTITKYGTLVGSCEKIDFGAVN